MYFKHILRLDRRNISPISEALSLSLKLVYYKADIYSSSIKSLQCRSFNVEQKRIAKCLKPVVYNMCSSFCQQFHHYQVFIRLYIGERYEGNTFVFYWSGPLAPSGFTQMVWYGFIILSVLEDMYPSLRCYPSLPHYLFVTIQFLGEIPPDSCWHACTPCTCTYECTHCGHLVTTDGSGCTGQNKGKDENRALHQPDLTAYWDLWLCWTGSSEILDFILPATHRGTA